MLFPVRERPTGSHGRRIDSRFNKQFNQQDNDNQATP